MNIHRCFLRHVLLVVSCFSSWALFSNDLPPALVNHAPSINGHISGSLQQMSGETGVLNSGAVIEGDWLVPGSPNIVTRQNVQWDGELFGTGSETPDNYSIYLNSRVTIGHVISRTDPVTLEISEIPDAPLGTQWININRSGIPEIDWPTVRGINLNSNAGVLSIPAGAYDTVNASSGTTIILGIEDTIEPSVYSFQRLNLSGNSHLKVIGPVILRISSGINSNSGAVLGNPDHPEWLQLEISNGDLNVNSNSEVNAFVNASTSRIIVNGNFKGQLSCNYLTVNNQGVVELIATSPNNPPDAIDDHITLQEDASILISALNNDTDPDGDVLSIISFSEPASGTVTLLEDGSFEYIPNENFFGEDQFSYTISDGEYEDTATVFLSVTSVNDIPVTESSSFTLYAGSSYPGQLTGYDIDGDALSFVVDTPPSLGELQLETDGLFVYLASDSTGEDSFTFRVSDGIELSEPAEVSIVIYAVNHPPTASGQSLKIEEGLETEIVLVGRDIDGDALTYAITVSPSHGTLSGSGSDTYTYTPDEGFTGVDTFRFVVSDGQSTSAQALVTLLVRPSSPVPDEHTGYLGSVIYDASTLEPLPGITIQANESDVSAISGFDGKYSYPVIDINDLGRKVVVLTYSAPGYVTSAQRIVAFKGTINTPQPTFMKPLDSQVTTITSSGGTATSAAGDVVAEFPVGAVSGSVDVRLTNYDAKHELPGPLPRSSDFTYAVDLYPSGLEFNSPVTVKIANILGFEPGTPIPVGLFSEETALWEHESMGEVSEDGEWVVFSVEHFSSRDVNVPAAFVRAPPTMVSIPAPVLNQADVSTHDGINAATGSYSVSVALPHCSSLGQVRPISLQYYSPSASGIYLIGGDVEKGYYDETPATREYSLALGGENYQVTYDNEPDSGYGAYTGRIAANLSALDSGIYPYTFRAANNYENTYGTTSLFGDAAEADTGVETRQLNQNETYSQSYFYWENEENSSLGAGWVIAGLSRVVPTPDGTAAVLSNRGGNWEFFSARSSATEDASFDGTINDISPCKHGGYYVAHEYGITLVDQHGARHEILEGVDSSSSSGYGSIKNRGISSVWQSETGRIYFVATIKDPTEASTIQTTGLYRIQEGQPVAVNDQDFTDPVMICGDPSGRIFVYDHIQSELVMMNGRGEMTVIASGLYLSGLSYSEKHGAMIISSPSKIYSFYNIEEGLVTLLDNPPLSGIWQRWVASENGDMEGLSGMSEGLYFVTQGVDGAVISTTSLVNTETGRTILPYGFNHDGAGLRVVFDDNKTYRIDGEHTEEFLSITHSASSLSKYGDGWIWQDLRGNKKYFDVDGLLEAEVDRVGNTTQYSYSQGMLVSIVDPVGLETEFIYDSRGCIKEIRDPAGRVTSFSIDGNGNLEEIRYPDGSIKQFSYDEQHLIVADTDPMGGIRQFDIDENGFYRGITNRDSTRMVFESYRLDAAQFSDPIPGIQVEDNGYLPSTISASPNRVYDGEGNSATYLWDDRGVMQMRQDNLDHTTEVYRNRLDQIYTIVDPKNNIESYSYDSYGNLEQVAYDDGSVISYTYHEVGDMILPETFTDQLNAVTTFVHDSVGNVVTVIDAEGGELHRTYNARGQVLQQTDSLDHTTSFIYNSLGRLTEAKDPLGHSVAYTYDLAGNVTEAEDALGNTTSYAYDEMDRRIRIDAADGGVTQFEYDSNGNRIQIINPLSESTSYEYDKMNRVTAIVFPDNTKTEFSYDNVGNRIAEEDALGNETVYRYDTTYRLIEEEDPLGNITQYEYDGNGNVTKVTDPEGNETTTAYDNMDRVREKTAPDGGVTAYTYDLVGRMIELVDPMDGELQWSYDDVGRVVEEIDQLENKRTYEYDLAGRLIQTTNRRGQEIVHTYDAANRLIESDYDGDYTYTYTYDNANRLIEAENSAGTVWRDYDEMSRLVEETQPFGTIAYAYDLASRLTSMTDPTGTSYYSYDERDRLTEIQNSSSLLFTFGYDEISRKTQVTNPNGVISSYTYDAASRLQSIIHRKGSQMVGGASYEYDQSGNPTQESRYEGNTRKLSYDENNRLTKVLNNYWPSEDYNETFAYDYNGNWTPYDSRRHNDANQLVSDSQYDYDYDEEGCLTEKRSKSDSSDVTYYTWNVQNQLVSVQTPDVTITFTYDALGRRIGKTVDGVQTCYLYDRKNVRLESEGGVDWTHAVTSAGTDRWLCREVLATGEQQFLHTDGVNSTIAVSDASGAVVERYIYSSYGELEAFSEDLQTRHDRPIQPYTFTGREYEPDAQLYYYRARFYDPAMGRFISNDPAGIADGLNLYRYAGNNPFKFTDPSGLLIEANQDDSNLISDQKEDYISPKITVSPNADGTRNVNIRIKLHLIDAYGSDMDSNSSLVQGWVKGIENYWSGKKGSYNVSTTVDMVDSSQGAWEVIFRPVKGRSEHRQFFTNTTPFLAAHEAGHHLGLPDLYDSAVTPSAKRTVYYQYRNESIMNSVEGIGPSDLDIMWVLEKNGLL